MAGRRSVNIYDYPEHLNPFFEDDNHTKLRFWTSTKRKTRSNSFTFQSIKDFKQSLFSRPTRKRSGTTSSLSQLSCYHTHEKNDNQYENPRKDEFSRTDEKRKSILYPTLRKLGRSFSIRSKTKKRDSSVDRTSQNPENEAAYSRTTITHRQTMPPETTPVHRVSITPLPRTRFHERVQHLDHQEKNDESKPASPTDDKNPFKDEADVKIPSTPSTSKPTTPPRKKKRAPPPPPQRQSSLTRKSLSAEFSLHSREVEDNATNEPNHKDISTEETVTTKTENINEDTKTEKYEETEKPAEETEKPEQNPETEPFQINYNSELNISSSEISVTPEPKLEQQQLQQSAVNDDSSDLLELVQKLQLEVEKLTDDTNNNVIASSFDSSKKANLYGYDEYKEPPSPSKIKTDINVNLDAQDDDNDVVTGAPLSPRFIRLRKDNEWIKH